MILPRRYFLGVAAVSSFASLQFSGIVVRQHKHRRCRVPRAHYLCADGDKHEQYHCCRRHLFFEDCQLHVSAARSNLPSSNLRPRFPPKQVPARCSSVLREEQDDPGEGLLTRRRVA